jgi:hypothetical protein
VDRGDGCQAEAARADGDGASFLEGKSGGGDSQFQGDGRTLSQAALKTQGREEGA